MSTSNNNFLRSVAQYYTEDPKSRPALERITFILPNKRSALFLKQYIRQCVEGVAMMPRLMTMRNFLSIYAKYPEAEALSLLFTLYNAYRNVMSRKGRSNAIKEFDSFVFWGDMMMSDFDDIDKSLVKAKDLFSNIKNNKEIQADFLTEEQKEVVRRIWGENRFTAETERFWLHLGDNSEKNLGAKFLYLWEILADIYAEYHRLLASSAASSPGGQYRQAVEGIKEFESNDFGWPTHYVFVGFNDFSNAEALVASHLKRHDAASFFWDTSALDLVGRDSEGNYPRPLHTLGTLVKEFPMPSDYEGRNIGKCASVTVVSSPSNVAQAKYLHELLLQWHDAGYFDADNAINTAIVLPDQSLLLPALLAIPDQIKALNISMGLSYRTTSFAILLHTVISMQLRARKLHGEYHFFYEDVVEVLTHPHIRAIAPDEADIIVKAVETDKLYNISEGRLAELSSNLAPLFTVVHQTGDIDEVSGYLSKLFDWLEQSLAAIGRAKHTAHIPEFEKEAIAFFRSQLETLSRLAHEHGLRMEEHTFFHLFERVFNARGLTLAGTPLKGLQILGVLETRALDFDNVIILSVNEGILPRKQYAKTMIPTAIRSGFRLPDFNSLEWSYAYCFYRLVARSQRVTLFYDARVDGLGCGEKSRYISQLRYLMPQIELKETELTLSSTSGSNQPICVTKNASVMKQLDRFRFGGPLCLSATALKAYHQCHLRFYLEYVRNMRGNDELVDYITSSEFGTIVHNSIQDLFEPFLDKLITGEQYDRWLDCNNKEVERTVVRQLVKEHFKNLPEDATADSLTAEGRMAVDQIAFIVRSNLRAEKEKYTADGFVFKGNERKTNTIKLSRPWVINNKLEINFKMSIDRVDQLSDKLLRFIDFKTGAEDLSAGNIETLFSGKSSTKGGMLQILCYCEAYLQLENSNVDIEPRIHPLRDLSAAKGIQELTINKRPIFTYSDIRQEFKPHLYKLFEEIFDPDGTFEQTDDDNNCKYCPFLSLCGRSPKDY